jgi:hypothetical protein
VGCNCGQTATTVFRLHRTDNTYSDYPTLEAARTANEAELGGAGVIRTARVVAAKK